jgi:hypothetical protein
MHALVCIHPSTISSLGRVSFVFLFPSFYSFGCEDKTKVMCHVSLSLSRTIDETWASAPSRAIAVLDLNSRALAALSPGAYLDTFRSESIAVGTEAVGTGASRLAFAG